MNSQIDMTAVAKKSTSVVAATACVCSKQAAGHADGADGLEERQDRRGPEDHFAERRHENDQRDPAHRVADDAQQDAQHQDQEHEMPEPHFGFLYQHEE